MTREALVKAVVPYLQRLEDEQMQDAGAIVEETLANILNRQILHKGPDGVRPLPEGLVLVEYYARSIEHLF